MKDFVKNLGVLVLIAIPVAVLVYSGERDRREAKAFEERAVAAESLAGQLQSEIDSLLGTSARFEAAVPPGPVPEPCKPYVEPLRAANLTLHQALAKAMEANAELKSALASRPKPKSALLRLPFVEIGKPQLGAFVGVCAGGRACAGAGVVLPIRLGVK